MSVVDIAGKSYRTHRKDNQPCLDCNHPTSSYGWCAKCELSCMEKHFLFWKTGDIELSKIIQFSQIKATQTCDYLEFIKFDEESLSDIYRRIWINGPRWNCDELGDIWCRSSPIEVALRELNNSQTLSHEFLEQLKKYYECLQNGTMADCFGITSDETGYGIYYPKLIGPKIKHNVRQIDVTQSAIEDLILKTKQADKLFSAGLRCLNEVGFKKDEEQAFKYFTKSANLEHTKGTYMVGYCYQYGAGVVRNERKAFEYYLKASELGHTKGIFNVGYCYRHGIGIEKDEIKALDYYKKVRGKLLQIPYNKFKNVKKIGQGGFSVIYKARWENQNVALKLFSKKNEDFTNEFKMLWNIQR
ncbi:hypothetical protein C2G38_440172 [Gigaspora rosea]|uniref:Protein kinase domain-containing protein n=1 Tax=Gigaspora rosea TaxID=44941 RepID=A0A397UAY7_9GLOM|nr:hypothetical protein C2G38_440172 [Gigaspora rosea]